MKQVNGEYSYKQDATLFVESDEATYNNMSHNTDFKTNIKIIYLDNIIYAENMSLDFEKNLVTIFDKALMSLPYLSNVHVSPLLDSSRLQYAIPSL